ncbi:MAG: response regulator [Planctomycetota bacterium]
MAKILIVDDDPIGRRVLRKALVAEGITFLEAENGAEGLDLARREDPDLILLDVQMPVMDGLETLRLIRKDDILKNTPVIISSATAEKARVLDLIKSGIDAYVLKPCDPVELRRKVKPLLRARAGVARESLPTSGVLVAHRRRQVRSTISEAFSPLHFDVREAETGAGLLGLAQRGHAVLAFVELELPVLRGDQVARRVRSALTDKAPILVAIENDTDGTLSPELQEAGFSAVVDAAASAPDYLALADRLMGAKGFLGIVCGSTVLLHLVAGPGDPALLARALCAVIEDGAASVSKWVLNLAVGGELHENAKEIVAQCVEHQVAGQVELHFVVGSEEAKAKLAESSIAAARLHASFDYGSGKDRE